MWPRLAQAAGIIVVAASGIWLRPLSYIMPLTYGADVLHASIRQAGRMPLGLDFALLAAFCTILFVASLRNIRRKWIP